MILAMSIGCSHSNFHNQADAVCVAWLQHNKSIEKTYRNAVGIEVKRVKNDAEISIYDQPQHK
jgi:hypothetical protein